MVSIKNIETESSHSHQNQIFFGGKLVPPSKQVSLLIYSPWAPTFQSWRDEPQHPVQVLSCHFCHARVLCSGYHDLLSLGRWGEYLHFHHDCLRRKYQEIPKLSAGSILSVSIFYQQPHLPLKNQVQHANYSCLLISWCTCTEVTTLQP